MLRIISGVVIGVVFVVPQTRHQAIQIGHSIVNLFISVFHQLIG